MVIRKRKGVVQGWRLKNKTIGDEGTTVDFWIIKVHTSN